MHVARIRGNDADHDDHYHHRALAARKREQLVEVMIIGSFESVSVLVSKLINVLKWPAAAPR